MAINLHDERFENFPSLFCKLLIRYRVDLLRNYLITRKGDICTMKGDFRPRYAVRCSLRIYKQIYKKFL